MYSTKTIPCVLYETKHCLCSARLEKHDCVLHDLKSMTVFCTKSTPCRCVIYERSISCVMSENTLPVFCTKTFPVLCAKIHCLCSARKAFRVLCTKKALPVFSTKSISCVMYEKSIACVLHEKYFMCYVPKKHCLCSARKTFPVLCTKNAFSEFCTKSISGILYEIL